MEGAACSTAPQPVVGGEEQGELGLAVHGGGVVEVEVVGGGHSTPAILACCLLRRQELSREVCSAWRPLTDLTLQ